MTQITVVTDQDLERQRILGFNLEKEIENPRDSVDPELLNVLANSGNTSYLIEFDDVKVLSRQSEAYPNPTLNHFALAHYLRKQGVTSKKVIDLGCGVGFLGNYGAIRLEPEVIVFSDLNPNAINQSAISYQLNTGVNLQSAKEVPHQYGIELQTGKQTVDLRIGNSAETLHNYDAEGCISLCSPMYLPGICEVFPQAFGFFANVAKNTGSRLYIGHSNLASDLVEQAAEMNGLRLTSKEEKRVPFLIEYTDGREQRICDGLVSKGLEIDENGKVYHKLMVSELFQE
ncbi:methyltransferase [Candidatus Woesearchaeota archaeon]|nr:methyltransferase [Candidatus Woesearchaeota archaeon]